jgi:hypothetical protein
MEVGISPTVILQDVSATSLRININKYSKHLHSRLTSPK